MDDRQRTTDDRRKLRADQHCASTYGRRSSVVRRLLSLSLCLALAACQPAQPSQIAPLVNDAPAIVAVQPLTPQTECTNAFVAHNLDFATGNRMHTIAMYASNGSGVTANDLNGDGLIDLAFASIDGPSAILWNRGQLNFEREELPDVNTRAALSVDVDGDGLIDVVFTHRASTSAGGVSFWRNTGNSHFEQRPLPGVDAIAYSIGWADLNGDNTLDLVTGSYNAEFKKEGVEADQYAERSGVFVYEQRSNGFQPQRLVTDSQSLSIGLLDLNGDGHLDIWAANDFALQDSIWLHTPQAWQPARPLRQTSHSTMSIDWADLDNSGQPTLFSTDMNPYDTSPENMAAWLPMMAATDEKRQPDDRQIMANVLLRPDGQGGWRNDAAARGIDASGWSWAGRFGDLDQDGYLDAYVVNGMIAKDLFGHLHNDELVEANRAYRNSGAGRFVLAPEWQLGSLNSGRGMLMADVDNDGDLDIVVNNLRGVAQLFENKLCGGNSLQVDLNWRGVGNRHAIGATLALYTSAGVYQRDIRASGGYLSGDVVRAHFGLPRGATLRRLQITWPDGRSSQITASQLLQPNALLHIQR